MKTVELILSVPRLDHDRFIGQLEDWASGFVQEETELKAYIPVDHWSDALHETVSTQLQDAGYEHALTAEVLAEQNWNETWEASITPVRVGPFLLCTSSADVPPDHADATVLRIDPKRSFGTGHHASTRLALALLAEGVTPGMVVVDVGTGTGVLAIAACHLGARRVIAVDTDSNAVDNARENVVQNDVGARVDVRSGSIEAVPSVSPDVIVANLTRTPLLDLLPDLSAALADEGTVILSGLLTSDQERVKAALHEEGLVPSEERSEDGWWAVRCRFRTRMVD